MQARLGDVKLLRRDDVVSQVEEATSTTLITTTDEETVCLSKLQQTLGSGNTRDSHIETQNMLVEMDELIAGLGKWQQQRQLVNMETAHIDSSSPITTHGAEPTDDDTITNDSGILERGSSESESRDVVEIPEKPSSAREHLRMVESNRNKNSFTLDENLLKQLTSEVGAHRNHFHFISNHSNLIFFSILRSIA
jgi:flagellar biosynthesis chaperone FliJ